ncbi:hypothetical protein NLX83_17865 [Allokutzneria sp. A3M-2-11 16]|uniref:mechanosensitive ion channel family protein n=1 Tax=Allokutzneria sp. A3M-2-11 16 TaxID=2962043 RepID=UPI0020B73218|nr:hypothetical protein [Allokutzneria sp. A3M-2-11 16]MCP3801131.1 hypothetical protein [Allokutzneria sp. A3M-2-11 16]
MGAELRQGLADAWSMIATFLPKLLGFLLVLLVGWLIAKGLSKVVGLVLGRAGFGRLVEKAGLGHLLARSRLDVGDLIVKLVYYFVLLIALQLAFGAFGPGNSVSLLLNDVIAYLPRIVVAIVLVLVAAAIARVLRDLLATALGPRPFTRPLTTLAYVFVVALGVIAALNQLGIATTVTLPVLITILATVGGILVVGVGGGLVRPMQQRWEGWLDRLQTEASTPRTSAAVQDMPTPAAGTPMPGAAGGGTMPPGTPPPYGDEQPPQKNG